MDAQPRVRLRVAVALLPLLIASSARADDALARIRSQGYFVWGGDQEGGGPYIFPDPNHPEHLLGFEADLADLLAESLSGNFGSQVRARFFQGEWSQLPNLLHTHRVDFILNGFELTPQRTAVMTATVPYYIYRLQLLARTGDERFVDIDSLAQLHKPRVGALAGSSAENVLRKRWGQQVEVVLYDGNTNAMLDVESGRLDATLQDYPIAVFYKHDFPKLRFIGEPIAPGSYVAYVRKEDGELAAALNRAIFALVKDGRLKRLYERYGIWTHDQEKLGQETAAVQAPPTLTRASTDDNTHEGLLRRHLSTLVQAAGVTVFLSIVAMPIAILLGILVALARLYTTQPIARLLGIYVEIIRGTPLLLQLLVIFYLLPSVGITMNAVAAAIVGLAINYSAYEAEIFRAGLQAVPRGQLEAALTLGMSRRLALRRIVLPQAWRIVTPAVTNDFISLFKDTSVCSVITVVELSKRYNIAVMNNPAELLPLAAIAASLYLVMSYPLSVISSRMEARLSA